MGTSKRQNNIFHRRLKVFKANQINTKGVDEFVFDIAKKTGVSKVTIYADLKFIKNNPNDFQNETT